ncbi:MAG: hypothetical protein M3O70_02510 [Actinomycetota bacterium]|nr:hypothetical protein [Actinomycetota bacterium]
MGKLAVVTCLGCNEELIRTEPSINAPPPPFAEHEVESPDCASARITVELIEED